MTGKYTIENKVATLLIWAVAGSVIMTGCGKQGGTSLPVTAGAEVSVDALPAPKPGTTFVYASGRWDRVESVDNGSVTWKNHRGDLSTSSADFTFRPVKWQTKTHEGTRDFEPAEFLIDSKPFSLWPLAVGKTSGYYENNTWNAKDAPYRIYRAYWSCRVEGNAKVTVPAGEFDTQKVVCARYS